MTVTDIPAARHTGTADDQLRRLLQIIAANVSLHLACVCAFHRHIGQLELIAEYAPAPVEPGVHDRLRRVLENSILAGEQEMVLLYPEHLLNTGFGSGLVFRLMLDGELIGALVLLNGATYPRYIHEDADCILDWVSMIHTLVENRYLHQQAPVQALQAVVRIMDETPSPQMLVNVMRDYLCKDRVAMCALLSYGSLQENHPISPFDYIEVQGSWMRRSGEGAGTGIRFYLDQFPDFIGKLDTQKIITIPDITTVLDRLDPVVQGLMRTERVQSVTLVALHTPECRLGILAIGNDKPGSFSPPELDNLSAVSEFLAAGTIVHLLRRQHDLIEQARSAMLNAVADGVMMVLAGDYQESVLTVNDSFAWMFQVCQASIQGLSLSELLDEIQIPNEARRELRGCWSGVSVSDSDTQKGEFALTCPDGVPASITWFSAPVYDGNRVMGRIYTFHDVSPERTAAALRANFVSWVSHELRTPLTSIKGFAEFILETTGSQLPELAREYTEIIFQSASHLNHVFTDIIEITRADTGQLKLNITVSHLPELITKTVARLENQLQARGQTIDLELAEPLPMVQVDSSRMEQVLSHLLMNAIQYAPPETHIQIQARVIVSRRHLPESAPPDVMLPGVLVSISDEGPGLAPEETEQVFLPFFRSKAARASKVIGTGLGLTSARSLIELHQGKIWAEPRRRGRRGATFMFTVPAAQE